MKQGMNWKVATLTSVVTILMLVSLAVAADRLRVKPEKLRLVRGTIEKDGSVRAGIGFGVTRVSQGVYHIEFAREFNGDPSVVASLLLNPQDDLSRNHQTEILEITSTGVTLRTMDESYQLQPFDFSFCFIAAGLE